MPGCLCKDMVVVACMALMVVCGCLVGAGVGRAKCGGVRDIGRMGRRAELGGAHGPVGLRQVGTASVWGNPRQPARNARVGCMKCNSLTHDVVHGCARRNSTRSRS